MEAMICNVETLGLPPILLNQLDAKTIKIIKVGRDIILSPVIYDASSLRGAAANSNLTLEKHFISQREDKLKEEDK